MADVTAAPFPIGSDEFDVPGDIKKVVDHFGDDEMFARPDIASLPASGNWPGRMLMTSDTGFIYRWSGTAWGVVSGDTGDVALSLATGWSAGSSPSTLRVRNGYASLNGRIDAAAGVGGTTIANLPVGARPTVERIAVAFDGGLTPRVVIIQPGGTLLEFGRGTAARSDFRLASIPPWPVT